MPCQSVCSHAIPAPGPAVEHVVCPALRVHRPLHERPAVRQIIAIGIWDESQFGLEQTHISPPLPIVIPLSHAFIQKNFRFINRPSPSCRSMTMASAVLHA